MPCFTAAQNVSDEMANARLDFTSVLERLAVRAPGSLFM